VLSARPQLAGLATECVWHRAAPATVGVDHEVIL
jgi:hypothetical protein